MKKIKKNSPLVEKMPIDVLLYCILQYVSVQKIKRFQRVNSVFRKAINENQSFWQSIMLSHYNIKRKIDNPEAYCETRAHANITNRVKMVFRGQDGYRESSFFSYPTRATSKMIEEALLDKESKKELHEHFGTTCYVKDSCLELELLQFSTK